MVSKKASKKHTQRSSADESVTRNAGRYVRRETVRPGVGRGGEKWWGWRDIYPDVKAVSDGELFDIALQEPPRDPIVASYNEIEATIAAVRKRGGVPEDSIQDLLEALAEQRRKVLGNLDEGARRGRR